MTGHVSLFLRHFEKLMLIRKRPGSREYDTKCRCVLYRQGTIIRAIREIMQNARRLLARAQGAERAVCTVWPRGLVDEGMQMISPLEG